MPHDIQTVSRPRSEVSNIEIAPLTFPTGDASAGIRVPGELHVGMRIGDLRRGTPTTWRDLAQGAINPQRTLWSRLRHRE
ncbi:hypothetical protein CGQ24_12200 [Arthrobacter sp. 7749]|nr:hypothetical protein CGQ24_12200 [Arthrobacter sp. 7749]